MPRIARIVAPGFPHHVTQRGSRNQQVFFSDRDKKDYLAIFQEELSKSNVEIWSYCLMDNHVHFITVPKDTNSLSKLFREAHKRYAAMINKREGWRGHLWQERFHSFVMDERYLFSAMRYVENNPVKAKMVKKAQDYPWSSAAAHVTRERNGLLSPCYLMEEIENWDSYLKSGQNDSDYEENFQKHLNTGRPMGSEDVVLKIEDVTNRSLKTKAVGRPVFQTEHRIDKIVNK